MAERSCVEGVEYKLLAGQPQIIASCPAEVRGEITFVIQTFGAERRSTNSYRATTHVLTSHDFIGLNPEAEYETANYQATNYVDKDGKIVLQGQEVKIPEYIDESEIPGFNNFTWG